MNLRELREEAGLTQKELASRLKMSDAYISLIERGVRKPGRNMRLRITEAIQGRGVFWAPPDIPFDNEKQKTDLRKIWLERGYGTE